MNCPSCKSPLKIEGQKRLETLLEHVYDCEPSLKDSYVCSNPECPTHAAGIHWNEGGELYCKDFRLEDTIKYIGNNDSPFGSFQRKLNVEIRKHDENFDLLKIFGWTFRVVFKYESNEDGDILKKSWKIEAIEPNHTLYISGLHMFFYMINRKNHPVWMHENSTLWVGRDKAEWWRVASYWWIKTFQKERFLGWKNR